MNAPHITVLQPDPRVPLDRFGDWLTEFGATYETVNLGASGIPEKLPEAVILLGGIDNCRAYPWAAELRAELRGMVAKGVPILGICLGHQLLADALDGDVTFGLRGEKGAVDVELTSAGLADPLFNGLQSPILAPQHHHDVVTALPLGATLLATSKRYEIQAFRKGSAIGVQFHPEASPETMGAWSRYGGGDSAAMIADMTEVDEQISQTGRAIARSFVQICT
ncbi:type 1 glutamine amidotransferase [Corynebacterium alimapuense]|uniref:Glutamine amidotransferase n=1 Tax=Corynebacterium alimapuense TaxID=1576874 RepID=A0A3M8K9H6_9CORY|nr:type 1 glutamine amidotransferase [Corynebacterium alimapuense]RNE49108.1 glutamine amidotransferase [Corynebacterium alimapuense]